MVTAPIYPVCTVNMCGNCGYPTLARMRLLELHGTDWRWGCSWLPVPLAVPLEGSESPLPAGLIILRDERMALLCNQDPSHFASESCKVVHWCLRFCQWPVKDNGNEHFSAIFLDEGRLAGLHFVQELPPPCFRTGAPIPPVLFAPGCQFVVGPL